MTDPFTDAWQLCDDHGMVSDTPVAPGTPGIAFDPDLTYRKLLNNLRGYMGLEPYTAQLRCTGSVHLAGLHIRCTSPAHQPTKATGMRSIFRYEVPVDDAWHTIRTTINIGGYQVKIIKEVRRPHGCTAELATIAEDLWLGSIVECSCGQQYVRRDDQRDGLYWAPLAAAPGGTPYEPGGTGRE